MEGLIQIKQIWWLFSLIRIQVNEAKSLNKEALQADAGLPVDRDIPLIAFIGRLEEQKGSDILAAAIPELMEENVQVLILVRNKIPINVVVITVMTEELFCTYTNFWNTMHITKNADA